jgi:hypothetical protein
MVLRLRMKVLRQGYGIEVAVVEVIGAKSGCSMAASGFDCGILSGLETW